MILRTKLRSSLMSQYGVSPYCKRKARTPSADLLHMYAGAPRKHAILASTVLTTYHRDPCVSSEGFRITPLAKLFRNSYRWKSCSVALTK